MAAGPLVGLKIVEFGGLGAGPFCGMLLADLGADVVRIDRADAPPPGPFGLTGRGRRSVALDLKSQSGIDTSLSLLEKADASIESFRPGVMERLRLGPAIALEKNPKLVYGRLSGWGQDGPLAQAAGHDINYIALTGALHAIGSREKPSVPLNLVGDYGGGALYLAMGLLAAVLHVRNGGVGQVIDCSMVDGVSSLMTMFYGAMAAGAWNDERSTNVLDGASHYYDTYQCADGAWISLGPLEPKFYGLLLKQLGLDEAGCRIQDEDPEAWSPIKEKFSAVIRTKTRQQWSDLLEGSDVCFAPVLSMSEAPSHPHNTARQTFVRFAGIVQPAPAPRFSSTPGAIQRPPPKTGEHTEEVLREWGCAPHL